MKQSVRAHVICQAAAPTVVVLTEELTLPLSGGREASEDPGAFSSASLSGNRSYGGETSYAPTLPTPIHWIYELNNMVV